jgi:hypothetical protein
MNASQPLYGFPAGRSAATLIAVAVVGAVVIGSVLLGMGASEHLGPSLGAAGICLAGVLLALELVRRASRVSADRVAVAMLVGVGVRLVICGGGAWLLISVFDLAVRATALWMMGWYLLMLLIELRLFIRCFQAAIPLEARV